MRPRWKRAFSFAPFALLGVVLFTFLGGEIVKYLWNWLTPTLFGLPQVTFWQALGLLALCRILFGGMGGRAAGRTRSRFRERIAERWDWMTPEERERARESWRGRWGYCRAEREGREKSDSRE